MPSYTYKCDDCEHIFKENVKMEFYKAPQECPECKISKGFFDSIIKFFTRKKVGHRIIDGCPMTRMGGEGSDRQIESMQSSFRQRYMKKDLDDTKHKFGEKEVNHSLVGGEIARAEEELSGKKKGS
jgi:putative FmdB family regulatory protein